jgi:hypothetical protein
VVSDPASGPAQADPREGLSTPTELDLIAADLRIEAEAQRLRDRMQLADRLEGWANALAAAVRTPEGPDLTREEWENVLQRIDGKDFLLTPITDARAKIVAFLASGGDRDA